MRTINADALKAYIDAQIGRPFIGCTVGEALKILVDEQPTVEAEPKWILCSERNPDETGVYLVTVASNDNKTNTVLFNYSKDYGWTVGGCFTIIAWMPLPKPYRAENEE